MSWRIRTLEVQGFRAFGSESQTLQFDSGVAVIWGPNSQGKTSLAEALEFLLTGQLVRRELTASSQEEFADALRNAHLPAETDVFVRAEIQCDDGTRHTLKRTLLTDFGRREDCMSRFEIDGTEGESDDLRELGIALSQSPMVAPVLTQYTLGYLFSARPIDRATYFKAVLEITDLEALRSELAALTDLLPGEDELISRLRRCLGNATLAAHLRSLLDEFPRGGAAAAAIDTAVRALLADSEPLPTESEECLELLKQELRNRREQTFPLEGFQGGVWSGWEAVEVPGRQVDEFRDHLKRVSQETRRLTKLFREVLAMPTVAEAESPRDCPVCETVGALTPERISAIRSSVDRTGDLQRAETVLRQVLAALGDRVERIEREAHLARPGFLRWTGLERRARGFQVASVHTLLGDGRGEDIRGWLAAGRALQRSHAALRRTCRAQLRTLSVYRESLDEIPPAAEVTGIAEEIGSAAARFGAALKAYRAVEEAVRVPLTALVEFATETTGWQDLIELAARREALRESLLEHHVREAARRELNRALRDIDQAKEMVMDRKFAAMSDEIVAWWNLLRPDGPTFFDRLRSRPGTRRSIDFKAGLSKHDDRTDARFRDVVAVFSQSQLHCLGLALFIARALREGSGVIVLDDPFLTSDDEHRAHFSHSAVQKLLDVGCQTIILTQDHRTWKDLINLYAHVDVDVFQIRMANAFEGAVVEKTSDDLGVMLGRAQPLLRSVHPDLRKDAGERLRDAAERFCKELAIKERRARGDSAAALSDYQGKTLGDLIPVVEPYLTDPSHRGKLVTIGSGLNPSNHDDGIPDSGTLSTAYGDLNRFKRDYL